MNNIYSKTQIKALDQSTMLKQKISGWQLMERAAKALTSKILELYPKPDTKFCVICGKGNNGGDGLAVARLLRNEFRNVEVILVDGVEGTDEFKINLQSLYKKSKISPIKWEEFSKTIDTDVIIDAILGYSCERQPENPYKEAIEWVNNYDKAVISIDVPSGMPIDMLPSWSCVSASHTLNIGPTKLTSLLPESGPRYGNISHIDINHAATDVVTHYHFTTKAFAEGIIQPRQKFSHKGTFGHAAIFAGSKGMMGAAVLSTKACLRSGVGLVTALVPNIGHDILQSSAPEAMCYTLGENILSDDVDIKILDHFKAMGIGCGIGTEAKTCQWIEKLLATTHIPMVIDADALNIIAQLKVKIPQQAIITPHPKEFDRLFGPSSTSLERIEKQRHYAHDLNITIVLKGHHTTIANSSGHLYFNSTGNAGMAKGGSGDVLTGLITGLLAQGYTPSYAAILGVYLHGLAGDRVASELGQYKMVAGDLIERLWDGVGN